jgi:uncharacterized protein YecE (DUF72 family)
VAALLVGSSGFSYREWKGSFYPAGLSPREYLRSYAERLPSVEVNATFHNLPSEESVRSWAEQTPPGFRFAVKLSRVIADGGRVERAETFCRRMRLLGERLGPILVQLERPRDDGFLRLLRDSLDPDLRYAWELRDPSWDGVEGLQRIDDEGGDEPFRYFRLRDTPYDDDALAAVAARLRPLLDDGLDVYCCVNKGDADDHSPGGEPTAVTALRLKALLNGT